jgi:hypothetical protein
MIKNIKKFHDVWKDGFLGTNDIRGEPSDCLQQVVHHVPHLQNGERTTTVGDPADVASPAAKCSPSSSIMHSWDFSLFNAKLPTRRTTASLSRHAKEVHNFN